MINTYLTLSLASKGLNLPGFLTRRSLRAIITKNWLVTWSFVQTFRPNVVDVAVLNICKRPTFRRSSATDTWWNVRRKTCNTNMKYTRYLASINASILWKNFYNFSTWFGKERTIWFCGFFNNYFQLNDYSRFLWITNSRLDQIKLVKVPKTAIRFIRPLFFYKLQIFVKL